MAIICKKYIELLLDKNYLSKHSALQALLSCCDSDDQYDIVGVLLEIGGAAALPELSQLATSSDVLIRGYVARALGKIGGSSALDTLSKMMNDEEEEDVQRDVAYAIRKIEDRGYNEVINE